MFRLRGYRRLAEAAMESLGRLERIVLVDLWHNGESSVSTVCARLDGLYAYTTVMTTLDRLYKKGLLVRRKDGRAFLYKAGHSLEEIEHGMARDIIARLLEFSAGKPQPVLSCIVDSVSDNDRALLDELETLVREKRAELEAKEVG